MSIVYRSVPQGTLTTMEDEPRGLLLFYGGPFSQWAPCRLSIDGVEYNCAEQYMMAQKARVFGDSGTLRRVMASDSPAEQKRLGRAIRGYSDGLWHPFARDVVRTASLRKFSDPRFKRLLVETGEATIVEASPTDVVWGVGLSEEDPRVRRRAEWRGSNWLGQVLMEVRLLLTR